MRSVLTEKHALGDDTVDGEPLGEPAPAGSVVLGQETDHREAGQHQFHSGTGRGGGV